MFFRSTPLQLCQVIYEDNPFIESLPVAQYIREHSKPDVRIAVIGSEPQIYFYSGRHSATGYIYTYPLVQSQPYAAAMQQEMIGEIEAGKPEYMVLVMYRFSWLSSPTSDRSIFKWADNYTQQFYELAGLIGQRSDGRSVWIPGSEADSFHDSLDQFMVIYHRKPDAN